MTPAVFIRRLSAKLRAVVRLLCWKLLQPEIAVLPGAAVVRSDSDWEVANEIFVQREYDSAICTALHVDTARPDHPLRIVDLGANVGFFSLRCLHLHRLHTPAAPLEIFAVEGSRSLFTDLHRRMSGHSGGNVKLVLKNGLAGRRSGKTLFYSSWFTSCTNQIADDSRVSRNPFLDRHAEECEYIDLESFIPPHCPIDLIKCDIEGSEFDFLNNYPDLIRRTRNLVIEFHPLHCDVPACRTLLSSLGFLQQQVIKSFPSHSLEMFCRIE